MIRIISSILILLIITFTSTAQKPNETDADIIAVTVYLQGAQITSRAKVNLPEGTSEVVIRNLPLSLQAQSLQLSCNSDIVILSVTSQTNYLTPKKELEEAKRLQDSLENIKQRLAKLDNRKAVLNGMSDLLTKNIEIGGANTGVSVETLAKMYDMYADKMTKIKEELLEIANKQVKLVKQQTDVTNQLNEKNQQSQKYFAEVIAQVQSKTAQPVQFTMTYYTADAGWTPTYDIRGEGVSKPVKLTYKASVWQNTGYNWDKIKINVSTGNPTLSANGPVWQPWYLNYFYGNAQYGDKLESVVISSKPVTAGAYQDDYSGKKNKTTADYTSVQQNQLAVVFAVDIAQSIPTGGKPQIVILSESDIKTDYEYYCIPKSDQDVFLLARITEWSELNLLTGVANVFFEGVYVGQTSIDANSTEDTLKISLGRDKKIVVKRIKVKDYDKKKLIGDNYKRSVSYDISARNLKNEMLTVMMYDQIPVSANSEITVELVEQGGADYIPETGKLTWKLELKPQEEKKLRFAFSVKYPKSKQVYAPRF